MTATQKLNLVVKEIPPLSGYVYSCRQIGMTDAEIVARLQAALASASQKLGG